MSEQKTYYRISVSLADDEWGNVTMEKVARKMLADHADKRPMIVDVYEHGGWHLSYLHDGKPDCEERLVIVGTANDQASLSGRAHQFGEWSKGAKEEYLGQVRRPSRTDGKDTAALKAWAMELGLEAERADKAGDGFFKEYITERIPA